MKINVNMIFKRQLISQNEEARRFLKKKKGELLLLNKKNPRSYFLPVKWYHSQKSPLGVYLYVLTAAKEQLLRRNRGQ